MRAIENAKDALKAWDGTLVTSSVIARALSDLVEATDAIWEEGYLVGNTDGYFGSHKGYDGKFGEGAYNR